MGMTEDEKKAADKFFEVARKNGYSSGAIVWSGATALGENVDAVKVFGELAELARKYPDEEEYLVELDTFYPPDEA